MKEQEIKPEEYKCVKYGTRKACENCDGFGRNLDDKVNPEDCYIPRKNMINSFDINDEFPRA
ncbi:MAG: hypothetical protein ABIE36_00805 [Candidatus Diapherotrites archaeon]